MYCHSSGTLLSVYEVKQGGTARTPGRQALTETLQQYTTMMKAFLREGRFSVDLSTSDGGWLGTFTIADQWKQFMGRLLEAYCQVGLSNLKKAKAKASPVGKIQKKIGLGMRLGT